jgi:hypothetical protein
MGNQSDVGVIFGGDFKLSLVSKYTGIGFQSYFGSGLAHIEGIFGLHLPLELGHVAFIPFMDLGAGMMFFPKEDFGSLLRPGGSIKGGLMFTTSFFPGLYLRLAYQHNLYWDTNANQIYPHRMIFGVGISF